MTEWKYTLTFQSSLNVFSGLAVAGLLDRMVVRNHNGMPLIPGSSVKGRWRYFAERMLNTHEPDDLWIHGRNDPFCKKYEDACTLCRIFGNPSISSIIWVEQAEPVEKLKQAIIKLNQINKNPVFRPDAEIRPGNALSRFRRTSLADHLFFDETLPPMTFSGRVIFKKEPVPEELIFMKAAARMVDCIGGRKAAGRGILKNGIDISGGEA